jgi:hypothetical protein
LSACLDSDALSKDATGVRHLLSGFSRSLMYHLTLEDEALYPALSRHPDGNIKAVAKKYIIKMACIKDIFQKYIDKWPTSESVQENPDAFIHETNEVLTVISHRMRIEEDNLYQLVERN